MLYAYSGIKGGTMYLYCFRLPSLSYRQDKQQAQNQTATTNLTAHLSEVHLNSGDIMDSTPLSCIQVAQGSKVYKNHAFLPDGDEPGNYYLHIINLKQKKEYFTLNLNHIGCEPEGVDIQGNWLYLFLHTPASADNKLYKFRLERGWYKRTKTAKKIR